MTEDERCMFRALQIARLGKGNVAPNPMVGAVLVHPDLGIVSEGWHQKFGGPHAEVHCLEDINDVDVLQKSTLYVTLEPCSHFGKTPPCADLIIQKGIPKVVVANLDPNPIVSGNGISKLQEAGIEVITGVLEKQSRELNALFITAQTKRRPFVTLKWAQTKDGFLARKDGSSKWISSAQSRTLVHKWRAEHQSIFVGRNTLRTDNPTLNAREWNGPSPVRIVLDPELKLSPDLNVFTDQLAPTWVFNSKFEEIKHGVLFIKCADYESNLKDLLSELFMKGINSLFVEGGAHVLNQFIKENLWDEALVFVSNQNFEEGIAAPKLSEAVLKDQTLVSDDVLSVYIPDSKG